MHDTPRTLPRGLGNRPANEVITDILGNFRSDDDGDNETDAQKTNFPSYKLLDLYPNSFILLNMAELSRDSTEGRGVKERRSSLD